MRVPAAGRSPDVAVGTGERWAVEVLGLSVEIVRRPPNPAPEKVMIAWAREWHGAGRKVDWRRLVPPRGYVASPRGWMVERTFSWLCQKKADEHWGYERPCAGAEAVVYAAMIRLMVRRLARG